MLLNKAAIEAMGLKNPVGMQMRYGQTYTVLGVIDNIVMESPFRPVDPLMIYFNPNNSSTISVRLNNGVDPRRALPAITSIFEKYNPAFPFEYQFVDEAFGRKFLSEELINRITNLFAALAIFICCVGLAGLASFTIEKRTREIGIRKAMGATITQLLTLISKEFLKLVLIAFVIAIPLTWWLMDQWLSDYIYHVDISIWLFATVGFLVLLLTLAVVSANTINTARTNPIKSLRTE
jgi:ABC-type antimicrobial peptide transport system permease subunit